MQQVSAIPGNLLAIALSSMECSSQLQNNERWPTFEEILQRLHAQGIYIHSEQLAEFLLRHGLPVHPRYVPTHLRRKALEVNERYQGDMVRVIEELEPPSWDFSWMDEMAIPSQHDKSDRACVIEAQEQPSWDYSWLK